MKIRVEQIFGRQYNLNVVKEKENTIMIAIGHVPRVNLINGQVTSGIEPLLSKKIKLSKK